MALNVLWECLYYSASALVLTYTGVDVIVYSLLVGFGRTSRGGISVNKVHAFFVVWLLIKQIMAQQLNIVPVMPPLKQGDCLAVHRERTSSFMKNIHSHEAYELHLIKGAAGSKRIVGDNVSIIGDIDLILLTRPNLPHAWHRYICKSREHEIIQIHFQPELFNGIFDKECFDSIRHMLEFGSSGLVFSQDMALSVYQDLMYLTATVDGLQQYTLFLNILNRLTFDKDAERIAGPGFVRDEDTQENKKIVLVKNYIHDHYQDAIYIKTLADLIGVEQQWLSASFKNKTGNTVIDYVNQVRLGQVTRRLINTEDPIKQIAYDCGYTNMANFNRHFKRSKGTTPVAFRREYRTAKI